MGSPITFSGFNSIDFNVVLNAIMQQESLPLQALAAKQRALQATDTNFAQLANRLDSVRTASGALSQSSSLARFTASSTDATALTVSASSSAIAGRYDVIVKELAHAQVTVSSSFSIDTNTTIVATGGTLTIGSEAVGVSAPVTLRGLVDLINANSDSPANASIVATASGQNRLVLTSKETGEDNAFTIDNQLTGSTVVFANPENALDATDATVLINNILVTSSSNTLEAGIPGVTLNLLQKDEDKTIVVTVSRDDADLADRVAAFVTSYNDLLKFFKDQGTAAGNGTAGAIGRESLLRGLRGSLRDALISAHGSDSYTKLAEVGIEFTRTGELKLDREALTAAIQADPKAVQGLFADANTGAFGAINDLIDDYTKAGGFVPGARTRLSDEISRVGRRMDDMQARLAIRRSALQKEFIAADLAISRLNGQKGSLASFGANLTKNGI